MKSISMSAHEVLIKRAKAVARPQGTTLNAAFREWLELYAAQSAGAKSVDALMHRLRRVRSSGPYSRDEMNRQ